MITLYTSKNVTTEDKQMRDFLMFEKVNFIEKRHTNRTPVVVFSVTPSEEIKFTGFNTSNCLSIVMLSIEQQRLKRQLSSCNKKRSKVSI
jgi:hypothetical protein